jgi:hypothetical protein
LFEELQRRLSQRKIAFQASSDFGLTVAKADRPKAMEVIVEMNHTMADLGSKYEALMAFVRLEG